jgi:hypothetical protein
MKATIYQSLAAINQATDQITENIEHLKINGLLTPHFAEIRILAAQQNCIETSHSAIVTLAAREMEDAARIEKERLELEQRLKSA